jgi:hypothetical protein
MQDNITALYKELQTTYNLGSEDDFRQYLSDAKNREALRKELSVDYNVGDSTAFAQYLGFGAEGNPTTTQQSTESGASGSRGFSVSTFTPGFVGDENAGVRAPFANAEAYTPKPRTTVQKPEVKKPTEATDNRQAFGPERFQKEMEMTQAVGSMRNDFSSRMDAMRKTSQPFGGKAIDALEPARRERVNEENQKEVDESLKVAMLPVTQSDAAVRQAWANAGARTAQERKAGHFVGNEAARLKYHDIERMSEEAWNSIDEKAKASAIKRVAQVLRESYGMPYDEARNNAEKIVRSESDKMMYEEAVRSNAPKNWLDYLTRKINDNAFGSIMEGWARRKAGTVGDMFAEEEANERYRKENRLGGIAGDVLGFAAAPEMWLGGGLAGGVVKGGVAAGGKLFGKAAMNKALESLIGKAVTKGVSSGINLGTFNAIGEASSQYKHGGVMNEDGTIGDYSLKDVGESAKKGALTGLAIGPTGELIGNVGTTLARRTASTVGKAAIRGAQGLSSVIAEGTIFAAPEMLKGELTFDDWLESVELMAAFKLQGAVAPRRVRNADGTYRTTSTANEVLQELAGKRGNSRQGFETRLRTILDRDPSLALTKDEEDELERGGYGDLKALVKDYNKTSEDQRKAIEKRQPVYLEPNAEGEIPYNRFVELVEDKNISEAARAKMYYYVTGHGLPMSTVFGSTFTEHKDPKGNVTGYEVRSLGLQNGVITSRTFKNRREAELEQERINRQAELNGVAMGEQAYDNEGDKRRVYDAYDIVGKRKGITAEVLRNKLQRNPEDMNDLERQWAEEVREVYDALPREDYQTAEKLRKDVGKEYKVDIDDVISKEPARRSETEKAALVDYMEKLFGVSGGNQPDFDVNNRNLLSKGQPVSENSEAYRRGYDADEQTRRDIAVEMADGNKDAQEAWNGVVKKINEEADYQTALLREQYEQEKYRADGSLRPATLKDGKQVYITNGEVVTTADGTAVDTEKSDQTVTVYDPAEGKAEMIGPNDIETLGEVTSAEGFESGLEQERERYVQQQIDIAQNKVVVEPGQTFTLEDGSVATILASDGETITFQRADGTQATMPVAEVQRVADELAIKDYDERHPDEVQQQPTEEKPVMNEGKPDEYVENMEVTVKGENGEEKTVYVTGERAVFTAKGFEPSDDGRFVEMYDPEANDGNGGMIYIREDDPENKIVGYKPEESAAEAPIEPTEEAAEVVNDGMGDMDAQGNRLNSDGSIYTERVSSIDEITDKDFEEPTRSIELDNVPQNVRNAIGAGKKPIVIKKNILERNGITHSDLTPEQSRDILNAALYNPDLYGQTQKNSKPHNWVVVNTKDENGRNRLVLLEVSQNKDNVEIVHWHYLDARGLEKLKRQADREDGQLLILPSIMEEVGALSDPTSGLSSSGKDTNISETGKKNIANGSDTEPPTEPPAAGGGTPPAPPAPVLDASEERQGPNVQTPETFMPGNYLPEDKVTQPAVMPSAQQLYNDVATEFPDATEEKITNTVKAKSDKLDKAEKALAAATAKVNAAEYGSKEEATAKGKKAEAQRAYEEAKAEKELWDGVQAEYKAAVKKEREFFGEMDVAVPEWLQRKVKDATGNRKRLLMEAVEEMGDDPDALAELENEEPVTLEEVAAGMLASGQKLMLSDEKLGVGVVKGLASMTGYGKEEFKKFPGMFAKRENGGMGVEELGEKVLERAKHVNYIVYDESDAMAGTNAILELFSRVHTKGDINDYILNNRIEKARNAHDHTIKMRNERFIEKNGVSIEEYIAREERWREVEADAAKMTDEEYEYIKSSEYYDEGRIGSESGAHETAERRTGSEIWESETAESGAVVDNGRSRMENGGDSESKEEGGQGNVRPQVSGDTHNAVGEGAGREGAAEGSAAAEPDRGAEVEQSAAEESREQRAVDELAAQLDDNNSAKNDELIQQIADLNTEASERWLDENVRGQKVDGKTTPLTKAAKAVIKKLDEILRKTLGSRYHTDLDEGQKKILELGDRIRTQNAGPVFVSNAMRAVEAIKQEKATAEQWLKMIEKNGGLKAGEDKWTGLSDFLKSKGNTSLTKKEVMDYLRENAIEIEEVEYAQDLLKDNPKLQEFKREYADILADIKGRSVNGKEDLEAFENEMLEKYGEGFADELTSEERERWNDIVGLSDAADNPENAAFEEMVDRYGDDFRGAFELDDKGSIEPIYDMYGDSGVTEEAEYFLELDKLPINETRLSYTTDFLDNKREIALVVPTIESWNEGDVVHFGDAGNGRAVAWVRFGETTDKDGKRVLVIDEIQSKRHQEGREKGYKKSRKNEQQAYEKADKEYQDYRKSLEEKYGVEHNGDLTGVTTPEEAATLKENIAAVDATYFALNESNATKANRLLDASVKAQDEYEEYMNEMAKKYNVSFMDVYGYMTEAEQKEADRLEEAVHTADQAYQNFNPSDVPDAPFEKNWHEVALKRMLRYAAENGYDKVAWTKGEQQAERYDIGDKITDISVDKYPNGRKIVSLNYKNGEGYIDLYQMEVDNDGIVISGDFKGKQLSDVVGKELAKKLMDVEDHEKFTGEDLRIGGEGMKGFYDQILPRFMNKYCKKWGVEVSEVELPNIGDNGLTMWSVDVTPEMKASVMEGQPMFQKVWHGSGADFDRFDHSHMGEGEGAQAFGYGTYVTEVEGIGRKYAENVGKHKVLMNGKPIREVLSNQDYWDKEFNNWITGYERTIEELKNHIENAYIDGRVAGPRSKRVKAFEAQKKRLKEAIDRGEVKVNSDNYLYEVEIPDDNGSNYLDWVVTIPKSDRRRIAEAVRGLEGEPAQSVKYSTYKGGWNQLADMIERNQWAYQEVRDRLVQAFGGRIADEQKVSELMHDAGFTGIKYPAEYMTGGREDGAKNYVIFDENDLQITNKVRFFRTPDGTVYGFTVDGEIYIDPRIATDETLVHEYAHLWAQALRSSNKQAWERLRGEMEKEADVVAKVKEMYPELIDKDNPDVLTDDMMEEVFTHYSGKRGAERLEADMRAEMAKADGVVEKAKVANVFHKIRELLKRFWDMARDLFAGKVEGIEKLSGEDFADMMLGDLLREFDPKGPKGGKRLTAEDRTYLEAVEKGDMETAQRMVNEAAEKSGYNSSDEYRLHHTAPYGRDGFSKSIADPTGIFPEDLYSPKGALYYGDGRMWMDEQSANIFKRVRHNPEAMVKIYRAVPKDIKETKLRNGDWVSINREYAKEHGEINVYGGYKIIEDEVPAKYVFTDGNSLHEQGYDDGKDYAYQNTKNNRKLLDAVTYDDEGNVIPLSKRFNKRNADMRYQKSVDSGEMKEMSDRISRWLSDENIEKAKGKSREEIIEMFGNDPQPIAIVPDRFLQYIGENITDSHVYSGMGYFIDHAVNHHPTVDAEKYQNIQKVLNNPDEVKSIKDNGNDSIVFIKQIDRYNAVVIEVEKTKDGKIIWHKSFYNQKKKPYANRGVQLYNVSSGGGVSPIIRTDESAHDGSLSVLDDGAKVQNNSESTKNNLQNAENEGADNNILFRIREGAAPKKTRIGYKVFVLKDGKLYPPMVANPNGEETPVGVWLDADAAPVAGVSKTGRQQVKAGGKGTQGGSGTLAYRPGWHLGEIPYALQFNRKDENGNKRLFPKNFVWAEVEYADDVDYQQEAHDAGVNANGKYQHSLAGLPRVPENGSYKYRTNPDPNTDEWVITGAMKVNRILTPSEVDEMVKAAGREPQQRQDGAVTDEQVNALNEQIAQESQQREQVKRQAAETLSKKLGVPVLVVEDVNDITNDDATLQEKMRNAKGWYDRSSKSVTIVLPNNASVEDVVATVLHETVAHKGLREMIGEERYNDFLDEVYSHLRGDLKEEIDRESGKSFLDATLNDAANAKTYEECRREAVDELFGRLAEKDFADFTEGERNIWQKIKDAVRKLLDRFLGDLKLPKWFELGDNELRYMLWRSKERLENQGYVGMAKDAVMSDAMRLADPLFREGENSEDAFDGRGMGMYERMTAMAAGLAARNASDSEAKNRAYRAIGNNLADLRKAMSLQKEFDKTTVKRVADLVRTLLKYGYLDNASRRDIGRLLSAVKNSTGKADIRGDIRKVMDIMVDSQLRNAENALRDMEKVRASKVDARGVEVQGALDVRGQQIMKTFKETRGWSEDELSQAMAEAENRMASDNAAVAEQAMHEYDGLDLALDYVQNIKASIKEERDLEHELMDARSAEDRSMGYEDTLLEAIQQNRAERVQAYYDLMKRLGDRMRFSIERAREFKEADKERVREIQHNANSDMEGLPSNEHYKPEWKDKMVNNDFVQLFFKPLATFDQMLRLFGSKSANGEGYLYNRFMRGWVDAREKEIRGVREKYAQLDDKVHQLFGKEAKSMADLIRLTGKMPKATVLFKDGGEMKEHKLTQGNMMYIYMADKMLDGRMKLRHMGIDEKAVAEIERLLDPRLIELADWMQGEFLVDTRNEYNETHKRLFGAPMAAIEHYFPLKINANARVDKAEDLDNFDKNEGISTKTGSIIKRRMNALPLDITNADALNVILEHVADMEHWNAFAEFNRDLNTLRTYKHFRNQVKNMRTIYGSGDKLWQKFNDISQLAAGTYRPKRADLDEYATNIAKGVTAAKVSFRIFTALKQFLSMPAYLPDARPDLWAKNLATPWASWNWAMENLPIFEERWKSRIAGDPRLMKSELDWKGWRNNIVQLASRIGMSPNAFVDALTVSIGAKTIYESRKARYLKEGYSEDVAEKRAKQDAEIAYNQTQQSSEGAFLSTMQVDRSWLSVMFTVFRNSSMAYQRQLHDALRNLKRDLKKGNRKESIEFMTKQMVREGVPEDKAEEAAEARYGRQIGKDVLRVAVFGYIMQFCWNLGAYLPYLLFGDDPDKKKKMWENIFYKSMFGWVEGLTGGDVMSEAGKMLMQGKGNPEYLKKEMPITSDAYKVLQELGQGKYGEVINDMVNLVVQAGIGVNPQSITDAVLAIMDACGDDPELAHEATIAIMRILQVPQSQVKEMYFDEVGLSGDEISEYTPAQLAERYAKYQVKRGRLLAPWTWDDEGILDKKRKTANKAVKERVERFGGADVNEGYEKYEDIYNEVASQVKAANRAKKSDYVEYARLMSELQSDSQKYRIYETFKSMDKDLDKLVKSYLNATEASEADSLKREIERFKADMVKALDEENSK